MGKTKQLGCQRRAEARDLLDFLEAGRPRAVDETEMREERSTAHGPKPGKVVENALADFFERRLAL